MSFFEANQISAGYGKQSIIENISFCLKAGSLAGIIGANGSGKTTLLKALCGILPHTGLSRLDGISLEQLSPRKLAGLCSYIPQRSGISIDISLLDVVLMGFNSRLGFLASPTAAMKAAALQALAQVGLQDKAETNYLHLSEGQKQLCIFARTLASESKLLLLDEPESALDFRFRHEMLAQLKNYVAEKNRAAIVALHDPMLALNNCDQLLLMEKGALCGILHPKADPPEKMERMLSRIYGPVSLQKCINRKGQAYLVMLNEEES